MQKLYPIANRNTRHLFIDPLLSLPTFVAGEGYVSGEMTSFIKVGKVPNLVELCRPEGERFSITEEANIDTMAVTEIIFGAYNYKKEWTVCHAKGMTVKLAKFDAARSFLKGQISVPLGDIYDPINQDENVLFIEDQPLLVEIDILYERATRAFTLCAGKNTGFDTGKPQLLGVKLNLDWLDSKIVK